MNKFKILLLLVTFLLPAFTAYSQRSTRIARSAFNRMEACQFGCRNLNCLKQAYAEYERHRKAANMERVNLDEIIAKREKNECAPRPPGSAITEGAVGGVSIESITVQKRIFISEYEINFLKIDLILKRAERDEILTEISALQQNRLDTNDSKELAEIEDKEKELNESLKTLNKGIIRDEKEFKKLNSFKFKLMRKLFNITQKINTIKN